VLIARECDAARTHATVGRKKEALECMKRKKMYDSERSNLSAQRLNLIQQEQTLQQLKFNSLVHRARTSGAIAIEREIKKVGGPDGSEQLNDRLDDALADASDVLGASSRVLGEAGALDDDELLDELEELERLEVAERLASTSQARCDDGGTAALRTDDVTDEAQPCPHFAQVPRTAPRPVPAPRTVPEEERELAKLMATMQIEHPTSMPMMEARTMDPAMLSHGSVLATKMPTMAMATPMLPMMAACY